MARQRTELPADVNAEIAARTARGESAETIFHAIGKAISVPTISRRQRELRGKAAPAAARPLAFEDTAGVPDEIPADTAAEDLTRWIAIVDRGMKKAEDDGNLAALASLAAKGAVLANLRHKSAPLPKADPNDNPDYKALAAAGEAKLIALVHELFAPTK